MALQRLDDATVPRLGASGPNGVALPLAVLAVAFLGFAGLVLAFARLSRDLRWKLWDYRMVCSCRYTLIRPTHRPQRQT